MSVLLANSHPATPTKDAIDFLAATLAGTSIRLMTLDSQNPHGGRGGSIGSDQCAWLVRELADDPQRGVVVATRHRSGELNNGRSAPGDAPRILADELVSILLAHANVLGWIAGHRHQPRAIRHGEREQGLWEMTPSLLGFGCEAWAGLQSRTALRFSAAPSSALSVVAAYHGPSGRSTQP